MTAAVLLGKQIVGTISDSSGVVRFQFVQAYRELPSRPVLSQQYEDDLERVYKGPSGRLPSFFANLVPESGLRKVLEQSLAIPEGDDFALLVAVGEDLPGAVRIQPTDDEHSPTIEDLPEGDVSVNANVESDALRFSLAGVQLKFSFLNDGHRLSLPAHGATGDWIAKIPTAAFPNVAENEFATMEWARSCAFNVPLTQLMPISALPPGLTRHAGGAANLFAIKRFDRVDLVRIHQEDMAQVLGVAPHLKYDGSYEQCGIIIRAVCGDTMFLEFARRLVFMLLSGNADAHLKNWSLTYPNGIEASLSPLYDQVSTIAWTGVDDRLALAFCSKRRFSEVSLDCFAHLAKKAGADVSDTRDIVATTALQVMKKLDEVEQLFPDGVPKLLRAHWARLPLIKVL